MDYNTTMNKTVHLVVRMSPQQKELVESAAEVKGVKPSEFARDALISEASKVRAKDLLAKKIKKEA